MQPCKKQQASMNMVEEVQSDCEGLDSKAQAEKLVSEVEHRSGVRQTKCRRMS